MTQVEALMEIARRHGGTITPRQVVDEARDESSVLHGAFTWDDAIAADKYRILEAQHLIRECRVTIQQGDRKTQTFAFVGVSTDRIGAAADNPYRVASDVAQNTDLMAIAERDALEQLKAVKRRFEHLKRLNAVWAAIDDVAGCEMAGNA